MNEQVVKIKSPQDKEISFVASRLIAVTKSDTHRFQAGSLYVGTGGDVSVLSVGNKSPVIFKNVPDGSILPVFAIAVYSTGTTASDFVVLY